MTTQDSKYDHQQNTPTLQDLMDMISIAQVFSLAKMSDDQISNIFKNEFQIEDEFMADLIHKIRYVIIPTIKLREYLVYSCGYTGDNADKMISNYKFLKLVCEIHSSGQVDTSDIDPESLLRMVYKRL